MSQENARLFIALELEPETKEQIALIQNTLRQSQTLKASWVSQNNFHLTLKFLGDTPKSRLPAITDALKASCADTQKIACAITEAGTFPNNRFPRVVWVGIEHGKEQTAQLARTVEDALHRIGFKKEKKEFKSHITVARVKNILDYIRLQETLASINESFRPISFSARTVTVFESTLSSQGPAYTQRFQLSLR